MHLERTRIPKLSGRVADFRHSLFSPSAGPQPWLPARTAFFFKEPLWWEARGKGTVTSCAPHRCGRPRRAPPRGGPWTAPRAAALSPCGSPRRSGEGWDAPFGSTPVCVSQSAARWLTERSPICRESYAGADGVPADALAARGAFPNRGHCRAASSCQGNGGREGSSRLPSETACFLTTPLPPVHNFSLTENLSGGPI